MLPHEHVQDKGGEQQGTLTQDLWSPRERPPKTYFYHLLPRSPSPMEPKCYVWSNVLRDVSNVSEETQVPSARWKPLWPRSHGTMVEHQLSKGECFLSGPNFLLTNWEIKEFLAHSFLNKENTVWNYSVTQLARCSLLLTQENGTQCRLISKPRVYLPICPSLWHSTLNVHSWILSGVVTSAPR